MKRNCSEEINNYQSTERKTFQSLLVIKKEWERHLSVFVVFFFPLFIYIITLSPTINSFDSSELISGAYSLGIVHSPGYPLYLLLGRGMMFLFPGREAYAMNLLSAVCGAGTVFFCYLTCIKLGCSRIASIAAVLTLGSTYLFWSNAIIAEVYSLNSVLLGITLYILSIFVNKPLPCNLYRLVFFYSLSLSHHLANILLAPWLAIVILFRLFRKDGFFQVLSTVPETSLQGASKSNVSTSYVLMRSAFLAILPFLLYLYLPLRFSSDTPINYVKQYFEVDLTTLPGIVWMISGRMFGPEMWQRSLQEFMSQVLSLSEIMSINFLGIGMVIGVYGLIHMARQNGSMAFFIIGSVLLNLFFFAGYNVIDNDQMITPCFVIFSLAIGYGFTRLLNSLSVSSPYTIFYFALPITLLIMNGPIVNRSNDWATYEYASGIMDEVPNNTFLVTQWVSATPLEYLQVVENRRLDVDIYDRGMAGLGFRDVLIRKGLSKSSVMDSMIVQAVYQKILEQLPLRPVYITEADPVLGNYFCYKRVSDKLWWIFKPRTIGQNCNIGQ